MLPGKYIIFIDADDYLEPNMLKQLYEKAIETDSDLAICDYYEVYGQKKQVKKSIKMLSSNNKINYMLSNPSPWNKLIKAEIMKKNGIRFLENYIYEDMATMPILADYFNNIIYVQKPLYNYIIRDGSTMRQKTYNKKLDSIFFAVEYLENEFKKRNLYSKYREELEFLNINHLLYAASGRFLQYDEGMQKLKQIVKFMQSNYPDWKKNKYYKKQNFIFRTTCNIFYYQNYTIIKLYNILRNK